MRDDVLPIGRSGVRSDTWLGGEVGESGDEGCAIANCHEEDSESIDHRVRITGDIVGDHRQTGPPVIWASWVSSW